MSFRRFFLVRLGWALFGAWLAVMLVFLTFRVVSLPKEEFQGFREPAAAYRLYREEQHFQDPVYERYAGFIWGLVTEQSTGRSSTTGRDSGDIAREAVPVTASLVALALLFSLALATAAGIPWGRARSRGPRLANVPIYIAVGLTPIFLGLELSYYVGAKWGLTPITGYCDFFNPPKDLGCGGPGDWLSHLILPVVTLSMFFGAVYARIVRAGVVDILAEKAKEARRKRSRRLSLLLARMVGRDFGFAIGAALLVEIVFSVPGLGRQTIVGANYFDLLMLQTVLVYAALLGVAVHFVVDVIVGALDEDLRAEWPVAVIPRRARGAA